MGQTNSHAVFCNSILRLFNLMISVPSFSTVPSLNKSSQDLSAVLLTTCKAMSPFTPFFVEILYQNLRNVLDAGAEESIHYCSFPEVGGKREQRIEQSVTRMMTVIDLARNIRERHNKPLKTPLREMVVVHPDADFLEDITGKLVEYVREELNVRSVVPCNDPLKYASLRAEPDFSALGKRLGKAMGIVSKEVKSMGQASILAFEKSGEVTLAGHTLKLSEIKVIRQFNLPQGVEKEDVDAAGDGDVLVVLDLRPDETLFEAGVAREIVNRVQKLRKKAGLEPTDSVEVYFEPCEGDRLGLEQVIESQGSYIRDAVGSPLLPSSLCPPYAVLLASEKFIGVAGMSFTIRLSRPALAFINNALSVLCSGDETNANGVKVYLLSRDHSNLKAEFLSANGKVRVACIEGQPPLDIFLGQHLYLSMGDYYLSMRT